MNNPASENVKTNLENLVSWYLADKLSDATVSIATKKYMTADNLLVYLTSCNVAASTIARVKIQVLRRVDGGILETVYQLYGDHRFEKLTNPMIFGQASSATVATPAEPVTEEEATQLTDLVNSLQTARQTL